MTDYEAFIAGKGVQAAPVGFTVDGSRFPSSMKGFQSAITDWSLRRGRAALFEGTGLGKTLQELTWASEVAHETSHPVIVFTPLAVAEQTVREAEKFGIDGVAYAASQADIRTRIVVTNYDRAHLFDFSRFGGVVFDESSIFKAADGKTRQHLTAEAQVIPYRLPATATPAPNDWTEIGQHAELLGVMTAKEMLSMFFVHDGAARAEGGGDGWRLKKHAAQAFWAWMASWCVMIRSPADLGFDEPGYILPPLHRHQVTVPGSDGPPPGALFAMEAGTMQERLAARRNSLPQRTGAASEIVNARPERPWLVWCNLNDEADAMVKMIPGAVQIAGADSREEKVRKMLAYSNGEIQCLITKPSIAGFGMNWQHCADMAFVGLNDSFEQLYQSIRRCWRFGQASEVNAYLIASEAEGQVVANLERKERDYEAMQDAMAFHMRDLTRQQIRGGRVASSSIATKPMELPAWMNAA